MSVVPAFGVRLGRLLDRRGAPATAVAAAAPRTCPRRASTRCSAARLPSRRCCGGSRPRSLHTADLFLAAGLALPDDLAPSLLTGP